MKHQLACLGLLMSVSLVGCGGNVVLGGGSNNGEGGGGGDGGGSGQTTGGGGAGNAIVVEEGTVEFRFMSVPVGCQNPDPPLTGCNTWELSITLPSASLLVPGQIDTEAVGAQVFFQEAGGPQSSDPNDCPGGGGGGVVPGTLEIAAVTTDHVDVAVLGFNSYFFYASPDGSYSAVRCP